MQKLRYEEDLAKINAKISGKTLERFCELDAESEKILQKSVEKNQSSMRGISKILKVARTIADLENSQNIKSHHLLEAISYRRKI